jgi:photosystem II stability/assembly factor-like uncharacterized protein
MKQTVSIGMLLALAGGLLAACSSPATTSTPTEPPERWQALGQYQVRSANLLVGFGDESLGISVGEDGQNLYTHDSGQTWTQADNQSMGLYGLEIVDGQTAFACGTGSNIRVSRDAGVSWQEGATFGAGFPGHCRFMSFVDAQTGWAATPTILGSTTDGAASWTTLSLPAGADSIASISLFAPGQGFLLDVSGRLYATTDNAGTWTQAGQLPLGSITIASLSYPLAAMRFQDASRGMVVIAAIIDGAGQVAAFQTVDGGVSWSQEAVPVTYGAPYLSRDGHFLTMLTPPYTVTVVKYNGK